MRKTCRSRSNVLYFLYFFRKGGLAVAMRQCFTLRAPVTVLQGVGEKKAQAFARLGIETLGDLLCHFPRDYEDRSHVLPIAAVPAGEAACIRAMAAGEARLTRVRRGMELVRLRAVDDTGAVEITFFNQSYRKDQFRTGETYLFYGRIEHNGARRTMTNPEFEPADAAGQVTGRLVPVYPLTAGLSGRMLSAAVRQTLDGCAEVPDALPEPVRAACGLCPAREAFEQIHFPTDLAAVSRARERLIFEELFVLAAALEQLRGQRAAQPGVRYTQTDLSAFFAALPFAPTGAQQRAIAQAADDLRSGRAMNRLVQGDVGSGKTLVAAALAYLTQQNGLQAAFMAPTEILAAQHFETLSALLAPLGVRVGRLTGSMTAAEKRRARQALAAGETDLVVGTHALISGDVTFARLALVIADEQHRFGVGQRAALAAKGRQPHVLIMSATPIPRTLALMIYADLDVSIIDELPPSRQKVDTFAVDSSYRPRLEAFIRKLVGEGRQVFVVCPAIEENETLATPLRSAVEHARALSETFPELRVGCVHGKMKPKEKDAAMAAFVSGETDILVSTTVVEVGVDVPNAALMIVENAERFGLSQLHQLRGRVGRGSHKSYCVLYSDAKGETARARLRALCKTSDGFRISEEDLRLRGPGDFFGARQHGLPAMHIAGLCTDTRVLQQAQQAARAVLARDAALQAPENAGLRRRIEALFAARAQTFS